MENDKFNRETTDKYLEILVKKYPKVDLHLLEYVEHLIYFTMLKNKRNQKEKTTIL